MRQSVCQRNGADVTEMSNARHDLAVTRAWVQDGTRVLLDALDPVPDADIDLPSRLSGWSRRHLLAHLARNAEALQRLVAWARSGVETPMYASPEQRASEIEDSAGHNPGSLRRDVATTATALETDIADLPRDRWSATVRSSRGRAIPAAEIPWMRAREVWLHALDLAIGVPVSRIPSGFAVTLVDDVVAFFAALPDAPNARLATDGMTWSIGAGGPLVEGEPVRLALWLTGRSNGEGLRADTLPVLPRWL